MVDGYEVNGDLVMVFEMWEKVLVMSYEENVENGVYKMWLVNLWKKIVEGIGD